MATTVLSNYSSYSMSGFQVSRLSTDDIDSICSEEDRCESDYSLSDIEEGLDAKALSPKLQRTKWSTVQVPVKFCKPNTLNLRAFVKYDDYNLEKLDVSPTKKQRSLRRLTSDTCPTSPKHSCKAVYGQRRRSSRLRVKEETAKLGAKEVLEYFCSAKNRVPPTETSQVSTSASQSTKVPESDRCPSPSFPKLRKGSALLRKSLSEETKADEPSRLNNYNIRRQTLSGAPTTCIGSRPRSSSIMSSMSVKINSDNAETTSAAVKKLKHYQRAMEAYRRSAEKTQETSQTVSYKSLPFRGMRRSFERETIVNFWGTGLDHTTPEGDDKISESDKSHESDNSSEAGEDISTLRRWPFVPVTGDTRTLFGNENSLSLDYRSALRNGSLKRSVRMRGNSSAARNPNRQSIDPDIVTDIDAMVGLASSDPERTDFSAKCSTKNGHEVICRANSGPEKIVWSGYEKYLRSKSDLEQIPRTSFKMRLAALEKKGIDAKPYESLEQPVTTSAPKSLQETESPYVNLRDNQIIRKRNVSRSNSLLLHAPTGAVMPLIKPADNSKYHTLQSPARMAKLLRKQRSEGRLSPVHSPSLSRPSRASSLKESRHTISNDFLRRPTFAQAANKRESLPISQQAENSSVSHSTLRRTLSRPFASTLNSNTLTRAILSMASPSKIPNALLINNCKRNITSSVDHYDTPRSHSNLKNKSTESSLLSNLSATETYSLVPATSSVVSTHQKPASDNLSVNPPAVSTTKNPSLQLARAIACGKVDSKPIVPGSYPTSTYSESDSDDDYVSYDLFYGDSGSKKCSEDQKRNSTRETSTRTRVVLKDASPVSRTPQTVHKRSPSVSGNQATDVSNEVPNGADSNRFPPDQQSALEIVNNSRLYCTSSLPRSSLKKNWRISLSSRDLFYGTVRRSSKSKTKPKALEISVPLTNILCKPQAAYNLTLLNENRKKKNLKRISTFLNDNSIQLVESRNKLNENSEKANEDVKEKFLHSVTRILKLQKTPTKTGKMFEKS